jgi:putative SOS response-associated peptidase YedK
MCGRVRLSSDVSEIRIAFSIPPERPLPNFAPTWNGAPTDPLPVVRYDAKERQRSLDLMRWGLIPYWAKDIKISYSTINAMAETVETKPAFREAFLRRRCLVPVDNFYEWEKIGKERRPYAIALADRSIMALAGLWETWRSPAGELVRSFTIVTTEPSELCAPIHNRMPVILDVTSWPIWLGEEPATAEDLKTMLVPYPAAGMTCWPVSKRVGNVKNNDPSLAEPI